jgi:hypothetical protein
MQITHRAPADAVALPGTSTIIHPESLAGPTHDKAPRLSCCCRISELLPLVRQVHDAARAARLANEPQPGVAA